MELVPIEPEYIYITIPAEYICVYHRILAMMADYGEDMLQDCKAACTDRNSNVIDCFNMFNAAVAARKLGKDKLAETLIKYIKAKINQIYKGVDNSTGFVFPVDEHGRLKAFVSCAERPQFKINTDDMRLYKHLYYQGFDEHFKLSPKDESFDPNEVGDGSKLVVTFNPRYEELNGHVLPCGDLTVKYDNAEIDYNKAIINYYFDEHYVKQLNDIQDVGIGTHEFIVVVIYKHITKVVTKKLSYGTASRGIGQSSCNC